MRVFVYSKKTGKKIAVINNVEIIHEKPSDHQIYFVTSSGESFSFDVREVKTTTYQN